MAIIDELIQQIKDDKLRDRIQAEADKLTQQKKFGLVFESHLPECTPLYEVPVKVGGTVSLKNGSIDELYLVKDIKEEQAICVRKEDGQEQAFPLNEVVTTAEFGEAIYPYLQYVDSLSNAPDSGLWHALIEADNYHALQLLEYLYPGKVDCIYIDPPYNTGARDWKYNNDYVDSSDSYRHSKWLSMMEKRLKLAKKLLNPEDSVLICTIDEKEYLHLGCLLEELFPDARMQMVSSVINPAAVARDKEFGRTDEYIFFIYIGNAGPNKLPLGREWTGAVRSTVKNKLHWNSLIRTGTNVLRSDSPNQFYPIYVQNIDGNAIINSIGVSYYGNNRNEIIPPTDCVAVWPIRSDGTEGNWQVSPAVLRLLLKKGYVQIKNWRAENTTIYYLKRGEIKKVEDGLLPIVGHNQDGSIIVDESEYTPSFIPGTAWQIPSHDASRNGSNLTIKLLGDKRFTFPKSLYAVRDTIRFFVANKPNALIVDFFAGSGTTLHAVNLLNAEDGGKRRCILVTNNEVSDSEAKALKKQGHQPDDEEWERLGIARYVTWPRTLCSIKGEDVNGEPLKGNYLESDFPMADGFKSNAIYFKLGFLDKTSVALGRQFKELLSVLWMKAGAIGPCPQLEGEDIPTMLILPDNRFAVLTDEKDFPEFFEQVKAASNIETVFIITDSEAGYREMVTKIQVKTTYQLYRDYLDNFRINTGRK